MDCLWTAVHRLLATSAMVNWHHCMVLFISFDLRNFSKESAVNFFHAPPRRIHGKNTLIYFTGLSHLCLKKIRFEVQLSKLWTVDCCL